MGMVDARVVFVWFGFALDLMNLAVSVAFEALLASKRLQK